MTAQRRNPTKPDKLLGEVEKQFEFFRDEGKKHRRLFRFWWGLSAAISLAVAFFTNFEFVVGGVPSPKLASGLAILLPVISAYIVMRSPEQLWIHEIAARNRLANLKTKLELAHKRDPGFDASAYDEEFFAIMSEASEKWVELKSRG